MSDPSVAFEPVIDLRNHQVVGFAAMDGHPGPWQHWAAAFDDLLEADLPGSLSLIVPLEPEALTVACPGELTEVVARAESTLRVIVSVDDRALEHDPAGVLRTVERARTMRWGVAVADVVTHRGTLAALPLVQPDVVTIDLRHLDDPAEPEVADVVGRALSRVEADGTALLVENVQSDDDARLARVLGATYGRGPFFGEPGPLPDECPVPRAAIPLIAQPEPDRVSPGEILAAASTVPLAAAEQARLVELLARTAAGAPGHPLVLACLHRPDPASRAALLALGATAHTVLLGVDMPAEPAPGVQGVRLSPTDPLGEHELVLVLAEGATAALVAHRHPGPGAQVQAVLTHQESTVAALARTVVRRLPPPGPDNAALPEAPAEPRPQMPTPLETTRRHGGLWHPRRMRR